jgi:hypothetical protein
MPCQSHPPRLDHSNYVWRVQFFINKSHIHFLSLSSFIHGICPGPRLLMNFRNKLIFYGEELLAPRPTPKLEYHSLSAVRDCLFNIFAATPHIWRPSPPSATWGRAMPWWQGTHLHRPSRPSFTETAPVPIGYEAGLVPEPVWTKCKEFNFLALAGNGTPVSRSSRL